MRKSGLFLLCLVLLLCCGCTVQTDGGQPLAPTEVTEPPATVDPSLLPDVYEDASEFTAVGLIEMTPPQGATDVSRVILYDEVNQLQFVFNGIFYTHRSAFASTGRTGETLTDIVEVLEYLDDEVTYENEKYDYVFEAHLLDGGNLLLWTDGEVNYSLASLGGTFEELCAVADLIIK